MITDFEYMAPTAVPKNRPEEFSCNPFSIPSECLNLDLLTDSGTSKLTQEQISLAKMYREMVPSIEMFSYARCSPREHLETVLNEVFGTNHNYYPAL